MANSRLRRSARGEGEGAESENGRKQSDEAHAPHTPYIPRPLENGTDGAESGRTIVRPEKRGTDGAQPNKGKKQKRGRKSGGVRSSTEKGAREKKVYRKKKMFPEPSIGSPTDTSYLLEYGQFSDAPPGARATALFIHGSRIDLSSGAYSSECVSIRTTEKYASSLAVTEKLIFVGLKSTAEAFNLFDFGFDLSDVQVYDHFLLLQDTLSSNMGVAVQMHCAEHSGVTDCTVLFHCGALISFRYSISTSNRGTSKHPSRSALRRRSSMIASQHTEEQEIVEYASTPVIIKSGSGSISDIHLIEPELKVIRFYKSESGLLFTDGRRACRVDGPSRVYSENFKTVLVDLACIRRVSGAETETIILLDRNGHLMACKTDFTCFDHAGFFVGFCSVSSVPGTAALLLCNGREIKKHYSLTEGRKKGRNSTHSAVFLEDGSIFTTRFFARQIYERRMLQVVQKSEGLILCTTSEEQELFKNAKCSIVDAHISADHLVVVTESGFIVSLSITS